MLATSKVSKLNDIDIDRIKEELKRAQSSSIIHLSHGIKFLSYWFQAF